MSTQGGAAIGAWLGLMWAAFDRARAHEYRLTVWSSTVMSTAFHEQTVVSILRVTTSYRAVELGLSVVWLGVITAVYAILPIIFAVSDRPVHRSRQ